MDDGRFPDGTCEWCGSPLHGLYDCFDYRHPANETPAWVRRSADRHPQGRAAACRQTNRIIKGGHRMKQYEKRAARRARRREERRDPENAPTALRHLTRGWAD